MMFNLEGAVRHATRNAFTSRRNWLFQLADALLQDPNKKPDIPNVSDEEIKSTRKTYEDHQEAGPLYKAKDPAFFDLVHKDALDPKMEAKTRWALLQIAQTYAEDTANIENAFRAVDTQDAYYSGVRSIAKKCAVMDRARKRAKTPDQKELLTYLGFSLIDPAIEKGDFTSAKEIATAAKTDAKNTPLEKRATMLLNNIGELQKEYNFVTSKDAEAGLAANDPAACQELGMYAYFVLRDQAKGAELLNKAKDPVLKRVGNLDTLLSPKDPAPQSLREVGDAWHAAAKSMKNPLQKERCQEAALMRLNTAYAQSDALYRRTLESDKEYQKAIKELLAVAPPGLPVSLLRMVDLNKYKNNIKGPWKMENGALVSPPGDHQYLQIPFEPPEEYDLTMHVQLKGPPKQVFVGLPVKGRQLTVLVDSRENNPPILDLEGGLFPSKDVKSTADVFKNGRTVKLTYSVRNNYFTLSADDKPIYKWVADYSQAKKGALLGAPDPRWVSVGSSTDYVIPKIILTPAPGNPPGKKLQ